MLSRIARDTFPRVLDAAGLELGSDLHIRHPDEFYRLLGEKGSLGFGEAFVKGYWSTDNLPHVIASATREEVFRAYPPIYRIYERTIDTIQYLMTHPLVRTLAHRFDPNRVGGEHYNIGFDFYSHLLGSTAKYTSAYWYPQFGMFNLDTHELLDMEILSQKLDLREGQEVLEVGFGYGTLAAYMHANYGVSITGLTVSAGQTEGAREIWNRGELDLDNGRFLIQDWKELYKSPDFEEYRGKYDRIVSVEMIEAVSTHDIALFFRFLSDCLAPDGIIVIQAINSPRHTHRTDGFIDRYIFPNGVIPNPGHMIESAQKAGLSMVGSDNTLGPAYEQTLKSWYERFQTMPSQILEKYKSFYVDKGMPDLEDFKKIWQYYLESCEGIFRSGHVTVGHFVLKKQGYQNSYRSIVIPRNRAEVDAILSGKKWFASEGQKIF